MRVLPTPPDKNNDGGGNEDDDSVNSRPSERRRNTRYENHSGRVELNIHNPTVNISTSTGVPDKKDTVDNIAEERVRL